MPTPIAHTLTGGLLSTAFGVEKAGVRGWMAVALFANLPDVDYLFGLAVGAPNAYHHGFTHSLALAFIAALAGAVLLYRRDWKRWAALFLAAYGAHLLLDLVTVDRTPPYGLRLFWPLGGHVHAPFSLLRDIHKGDSNGAFLRSVLAPYNALTGLAEMLIFGPLWGVALLWRRGFKTSGKHA